MNDLEGLSCVPRLKHTGVASLKIEGRLRSTTYVNRIVTAYRMVIDADDADANRVVREAERLIPEALGRKTGSGYFTGAHPKDAVTPQHSGNIGGYLGRIKSVLRRGRQCYGVLDLRLRCAVGDRLRLHDEQSGERTGFTLERICTGAADTSEAAAGQQVELLLPELAGDGRRQRYEVYRVDGREEFREAVKQASGSLKPDQALRARIARAGEKGASLRRVLLGASAHPAGTASERRGGRRKKQHTADIWIRTDRPQIILEQALFQPARWIINLDRKTMAMTGRLKGVRRGAARNIVWALPPVILPASVAQMRKNISVLIRSGFRNFQIAHLSQLGFFAGQKVSVWGDYSLNLLNSQAISQVGDLGLEGVQLCIEADRGGLQQVTGAVVTGGRSGEEHWSGPLLGLTVFGAPPLFTSRLSADPAVYGRPVISPKQERFIVEKRDGMTVTRPLRPFSLLPYRDELQTMGFNYLVVDLCGLPLSNKEYQELGKQLLGKAKPSQLPCFNYRGELD